MATEITTETPVEAQAPEPAAEPEPEAAKASAEPPRAAVPPPPPPPSTHIDLAHGRPDWFARAGAPRRGPSRVMLELLLVDNRTGLALWHARQELRADPTRAGDVARAMKHLLATLPRGTRTP